MEYQIFLLFIKKILVPQFLFKNLDSTPLNLDIFEIENILAGPDPLRQKSILQCIQENSGAAWEPSCQKLL